MWVITYRILWLKRKSPCLMSGCRLLKLFCSIWKEPSPCPNQSIYVFELEQISLLQINVWPVPHHCTQNTWSSLEAGIFWVPSRTDLLNWNVIDIPILHHHHLEHGCNLLLGTWLSNWYIGFYKDFFLGIILYYTKHRFFPLL